MNASVSSCNWVDDVVTSSPPNCGQTSPGACTGCTIAPLSSTVPYVANASDVAGVHTGSDTSAASAKLPEVTANWNRAVPAFIAATGNLTSTRSFAGKTTL